jgi:dihydropteroate synthase
MKVMGVVNVTTDSFYDGGRHSGVTAAVAHGEAMFKAGASIVDVGGESTRPGAMPVGLSEELDRVMPVVERLVRVGQVSIDTRKPEVAMAALKAGAAVLNDVSGRLYEVAGEYGAGYVAMHMQGQPTTMQDAPRYDDVVGEVTDFLLRVGRAAYLAGVSSCWIDPGIGFGKAFQHNLALLRALPGLSRRGFPVLLGVSRKRFLGDITKRDDPADRLAGSLAVALYAAEAGVDVLRVHDVPETIDCLAVHDILRHAD